MTVTEKLKPCPFCGSAERLAFQSVGSLVGDMPARPFRVVCTDIGHGDVHGPVAYGKAEALTAWNTRPAPALDREGVARKAEELILAGLFDHPHKKVHGAMLSTVHLVASDIADAILAMVGGGVPAGWQDIAAHFERAPGNSEPAHMAKRARQALSDKG